MFVFGAVAEIERERERERGTHVGTSVPTPVSPHNIHLSQQTSKQHNFGNPDTFRFKMFKSEK